MKRKEVKEEFLNICRVCSKEDSKERAFEKCGSCKHYSYCGKEHQRIHWFEQNHKGECRQLKILKKYCKPRYLRNFREAILHGEDPKTIVRLQTIRTQLGLTRPEEDYEKTYC